MLRLVGIVAVFVLAACGQTSGNAGPSPSPVAAQGSWTQNLVLTGELPGRITTIVADQGTQQTFCSGAKARNGETWASTFYTTVDSTGNEWQLSMNVVNFRGPGSYANRDVQISLQAPDNSRAWLNQAADTVSFTIDRTLQSGTIDASLTSAYSGKKAAERIVGTWNCRG